jgi:methylated-DNA-[protein]-cysteine S-methyltransferase
MSTPAGELVIAGDDDVAGIWFHREIAVDWVRDDAAFPIACAELGEWFAGDRRDFTFPVEPRGTAFQHRVWAALRAIPYGTIRTYADVATELGSAPRAVGRANARNPLSVVIPCHRLIGSDGGLRGYLGGTGVKRWLLDHERLNAELARPVQP